MTNKRECCSSADFQIVSYSNPCEFLLLVPETFQAVTRAGRGPLFPNQAPDSPEVSRQSPGFQSKHTHPGATCLLRVWLQTQSKHSSEVCYLIPKANTGRNQPLSCHRAAVSLMEGFKPVSKPNPALSGRCRIKLKRPPVMGCSSARRMLPGGVVLGSCNPSELAVGGVGVRRALHHPS